MFGQTSHNQQEKQCFKAFTPPLRVVKPAQYNHGIIFASPHSGRIYPPAFTKRTHLPLATLRRNEDALMDELIAPLPGAGFPALLAHFPRCFVDVNRAPDELLPSWNTPQKSGAKPTARAQAGLGVIPTMIGQNLPIYKAPLPKDVVSARLENLYHPYHAALQGLIDQAKARTGLALLIDCHSMPGSNQAGRARHDIVIGDRFGTSACPEFVTLTEELFNAAGYSVTRNHPYAGGYVTSKYGEPSNNTHVIQIEVNRSLYMNPASFKRTNGFAPLQACFLDLAQALYPYMVQGRHPRAAE